LAFYTYPTAVDTMSWPNFWAFILGSTLFMLGIDSSFSAIEASVTVISDTQWGSKMPRAFIAFVLCLVGFIGSIPFCFNWGFIFFDIVDHYLTAYLLNLIGILQAFGCGWFFDVADTIAKSNKHKNSLYVLSFGYWIPLMIITIVFTITKDNTLGYIIFAVCQLLVIITSFIISGMPFGQWYNEIMMCGVRKIAYACSQITRKDENEVMWWEPIFAFYWGITTKFINPCILMFILLGIF